MALSPAGYWEQFIGWCRCLLRIISGKCAAIRSADEEKTVRSADEEKT